MTEIIEFTYSEKAVALRREHAPTAIWCRSGKIWTISDQELASLREAFTANGVDAMMNVHGKESLYFGNCKPPAEVKIPDQVKLSLNPHTIPVLYSIGSRDSEIDLRGFANSEWEVMRFESQFRFATKLRNYKYRINTGQMSIRQKANLVAEWVRRHNYTEQTDGSEAGRFLCEARNRPDMGRLSEHEGRKVALISFGLPDNNNTCWAYYREATEQEIRQGYAR